MANGKVRNIRSLCSDSIFSVREVKYILKAPINVEFTLLLLCRVEQNDWTEQDSN